MPFGELTRLNVLKFLFLLYYFNLTSFIPLSVDGEGEIKKEGLSPSFRKGGGYKGWIFIK
jgi:hypothetical protein